jgi:predicted transcriptional regulator of viral defense system
MPDTAARLLNDHGISTAIFRPRDLVAHGITYYQLRKMVAEGGVESIGGGLYRLASAEFTELEGVAMIAAAVPHAIICLLTALSIHEIGTQLPHQVWLAIDRKARKPVRLPISTRIVRFSGAMLTYGVVERKIQGVPVRITNPARTVVDCFRYRNKVGLDVALEALREAVRSRKTTIAELDRVADATRISSVIGPYLHALAT